MAASLLGQVVFGDPKLVELVREDEALAIFAAVSTVDGGPYTVALVKEVPVETSAAALEAAVERTGSFAARTKGVLSLLHARALSTPAGVRLGVMRRGEPGTALSADIARGPHSIDEVARLLAPLATALGSLHEQGLVCGVLSPETVIVRNGTPMLDLIGLATVAEVAYGARGVRNAIPPAYRPPELASLVPLSPGPWSDVYALALLASELLAGRSCNAPSEEALVLSSHVVQARSPRALGANVPDALEQAFQQALSSSPSVRPRDIRTLIRTLREAASAQDTLQQQSTSSEPLTAGHQTTVHTMARVSLRPASRNLGVGLALMLLGFGGAAATAYWLLFPQTTEAQLPSAADEPSVSQAPAGSIVSDPSPTKTLPRASNDLPTYPEEQNALVPLGAEMPTRGGRSALVTLVLFGDLTCPFTARSLEELPQLEASYGGSLRVAFKYYPLADRPDAQQAAEAAATVRAQGGNEAFWKFIDAALHNTRLLDGPGGLEELGIKAGLPAGAMTEALQRHRYAVSVDRDVQLGRRLGLRGTPVWFLNGRRLDGFQPVGKLTPLLHFEEPRARKVLATGVMHEQLYAKRVFANITSSEGEQPPL